MTILTELQHIDDGPRRDDTLLIDNEDAPILNQLAAYKPPVKRVFTPSEIECFVKYYDKTGSKNRTCRYFDITRQELEEALRS